MTERTSDNVGVLQNAIYQLARSEKSDLLHGKNGRPGTAFKVCLIFIFFDLCKLAFHLHRFRIFFTLMQVTCHMGLPSAEYANILLLAQEHSKKVSTDIGVSVTYLEDILTTLVDTSKPLHEVTPPVSRLSFPRVPNRLLELIAAKSSVYGASGDLLINAQLCAEICFAGKHCCEQ